MEKSRKNAVFFKNLLFPALRASISRSFSAFRIGAQLNSTREGEIRANVHSI